MYDWKKQEVPFVPAKKEVVELVEKISKETKELAGIMEHPFYPTISIQKSDTNAEPISEENQVLRDKEISDAISPNALAEISAAAKSLEEAAIAIHGLVVPAKKLVASLQRIINQRKRR